MQYQAFGQKRDNSAEIEGEIAEDCAVSG